MERNKVLRTQSKKISKVTYPNGVEVKCKKGVYKAYWV